MLSATNALDDNSNGELKRMLQRIVSMLTRLIARSGAVAEPAVEYEYEYRVAEYEYEGEDRPEPRDPTERRQRLSSTSMSSLAAR